MKPIPISLPSWCLEPTGEASVYGGFVPFSPDAEDIAPTKVALWSWDADHELVGWEMSGRHFPLWNRCAS